ncbi:endonuclease-reverse transcriptase [Plakobranchus ocellatus]|uniref:Endonuclease-reverse transcriptase n=1 Tax=Plakobranchus ocellatus TaxID=259542 RepID=A0AAV4A7K1_9GAST|nr:endonuclease-reverse transcriptase [Plakobranchus ocellatus]
MLILFISIFLYTYETWTLTTHLERRIKAMEMRCFRRLLGISYKDHTTNEGVRSRIRQAIGNHDDVLTIVKNRKLEMVWTCHTITGARQDIPARHCSQGEIERIRSIEFIWQRHITRRHAKNIYMVRRGNIFATLKGDIRLRLLRNETTTQLCPIGADHSDAFRTSVSSLYTRRCLSCLGKGIPQKAGRDGEQG